MIDTGNGSLAFVTDADHLCSDVRRIAAVIPPHAVWRAYHPRDRSNR